MNFVVSALLDALALVLPTECAGCGVPDRAVCDACRVELHAEVVSLEAAPGGPRAIGPPLQVWSALSYRGAVKNVLAKLKEGGRTDVARALSEPLSVAVRQAVWSIAPRLPPGGRLEITLAPSSRAAYRTRGYNPVAVLARRAAATADLRCTPMLRVNRQTLDQAGLGLEARHRNLDGSIALGRRFSAGSPRGRNFLLVDDVITTGATLLECRRALELAGASVWGAATLAFTERRTGVSAVTRAVKKERTSESAE